MTDLRLFRIVPNLPPPLTPLLDLARNLWSTWNPEALGLFAAMDPELWEKTYHNPMKFLGEIGQDRLNALAADGAFVDTVKRIHARFGGYLERVRARQGEAACRVGYFSLEFGLSESLPLYSGGLGVLAGDHIKSASDLGLSFVGVSLLYQLGYFQQYLNQDGWQQDFYQTNDFHNMRVQPLQEADGRELEVELEWPGGPLRLRAWRIEVGGTVIVLLDANHRDNRDDLKRLTAQLYGGDRQMRLQQEMILGIGGIRLLAALDLMPDVIHMNEGHSAFASFERARLLKEAHAGMTFEEALEAVRLSGVFTTHTPVPAGNDEFDPGLMRTFFSAYVERLGLSMDAFLSLGRIHRTNPSQPFSMTVAALRNSRFINGVSRLHAEVSRNMWKQVWPAVPVNHVPITHVTNGIHIPSWVSTPMRELWSRHLGEDWEAAQDSPETWKKLGQVPDGELWDVHRRQKEQLVDFTRERLKRQLIKKGASRMLVHRAQSALRPEALTIGLARRFATYKRGDLILRDPERLLAMLNHPDRPVQLIFAGKAHPQDNAGKEVIKNIVHFINSHDLMDRVVFIEDYDINVARHMVQGVDVWLNNPQRPFEACGTSGMKAAVNGVLHLSVLDGWWEEAFDYQNGWAIGSGEVYSDRTYQNEVESHAIYSILETDILPLYYDRDPAGTPRQWVQMMKQAIASIACRYNTQRMVKEYDERFYRPAGETFAALRRADFKPVREYLAWRRRMEKEFPQVKIESAGVDNGEVFLVGQEVEVSAELSLGGLAPGEVRVEAYYGTLGAEDEIVNPVLQELDRVEEREGGRTLFSGRIPGQRTGQFAYRIRVTPRHDLLFFPYGLNLVLWS